MKPLAIIGLDPGITSAYAALSLDGEIIGIASSKEFSLSSIISAVIAICQPLFVATDKAKIPGLVEEATRKLGCASIAPSEDLTKAEKRQLLQAHLPPARDHHQEDALAAALFAYKKLFPRLEKIRSFLQEHPLPAPSEFYKLALTQDLNFALITKILTSPAEEEEVMKAVMQEQKLTPGNFLRLYRKLQQLQQEKSSYHDSLEQAREEIRNLKNKLQRFDRKSWSLQEKVDTLVKFKESRILLQTKTIQQEKQALQKLQATLQQAYQFIGRTNRFILIKKLSSLTKKEYEEKNIIVQIREGDYLWVEQPWMYSESIIEDLMRQEIVLLAPQRATAIEKRLPLLIFIGPFEVENEYFALLKREVLDKLKTEKGMLEKVVREYKEKRA